MNISHSLFKRGLIFTKLILAVFIFTAAVRAGGEVDLAYNANAYNRGTANVAVTQSDGKIIIGGNFTVVNGVAKSGIIRVNSNGTLDTTFNTAEIVNGMVNSVAFQSNGKILVGGNFTVTGTNYKDLIRLNADGSLDTSFASSYFAQFDDRTSVNKIVVKNGSDIYVLVDIYTSSGNGQTVKRLTAGGDVDPNFMLAPVGPVYDLEILPDGKLIIALDSAIYRLYDYGPVDTSYPFKVTNGQILDITIQPDGKILVGGSFTSYDNFNQPFLSRINSDSSVDISFNPNGTRANGPISKIEVAADGKIIIAGSFTKYDNIDRNGIARLNTDGTLDTSFNPAFPGFLSLQSDGRILVKNSNEVRRLNLDGTADALFNTLTFGSGGAVYALAQQTDGKVIAGGNFIYANGLPRKVLARYNTDGSLDTNFAQTAIVDSPNFTSQSTVYAVAIQSDGKILVGGFFTNNSSLIRLNLDGSQDTTFQPATPVNNSNIVTTYDIDILSDGRILVNGRYKLEANGAFSPNFTPPIFSSGEATVAVEQPDGKILIGGIFTQVNGVLRGGIARLNANGMLDSTFNPPIGANNGGVRDIALQTDGKIILVGAFSGLNGDSTKKYIGRLNSDGSTDASFSPILTNALNAVKIQPDGKILIGGATQTINGISRNGYARLNADGTIDATFTVGSGANGNIYRIALQPDNKILLGGSFSKINNIAKVNIARLLNSSTFRTPFDFDGDGRADLSVFRPANGSWYILGSQSNSFSGIQFGSSGDKIAPADYDGDGKADLAVFRENITGTGSTGAFYILNSADNSFRPVAFGSTGDVPVSGDWDGDGKADVAVYRDGSLTGGASLFLYRPSSQPGADFRAIPWGAAGDKPVVGDYDGDGKLDAAIWRPSIAQWYILRSSNNQFFNVQFGQAGDVLTPADYNGDGITEVGVFRPANGTWYYSASQSTPSTIFTAIQFGQAGDVPVPADYDGDGRADVAVFHPSNGIWYLNRTTQGFTGIQFGASGDKPAPNAYVR